MTDHDALARRIAYELSITAWINPSGWTAAEAASLIANVLREVLPTSEAKSLTPEQVERARALIRHHDQHRHREHALVGWSNAVELLREVVGDE